MMTVVLVYGLISGAIAAAMMLVTIPFVEQIGFDWGMVVGYTTIVAAFLLVFFGIRSYRERNGGTVTFGRAFTVGILISLISSLCYVATWHVISYRFAPDFMDKYAAHLEEKARRAGATEREIQQTRLEMQQFKKQYENPLFRAALTFLEPFPVGLLVTLISSAILRRRETVPLQATGAATMTSR